MDDRARRMVFFIFAILVVAGFGFAINFNLKAKENRRAFENEMAFRLDMEENVNKLRNEKMDLTTAIQDKDLEIQDKDKLITELNKTVADQKETIESLQLELKGMTLLKEQLENNLKTELSQKQR